MLKKTHELSSLELKYAAAVANGWKDLEKSGGHLRMEVLIESSTHVEYFLKIECDTVEAAIQYAEELKCSMFYTGSDWRAFRGDILGMAAQGKTLTEALIRLYCMYKIGSQIEIPKLIAELHENS